MIELIQAKIKQLQEESTKIMDTMAKINETIRNCKEQYKAHQAKITHASGAIEAFQATINAMKSNAQKPEVIDAINHEPGA